MKVRMKVSIAGNAMPQYGITGIFALSPGDELDLDDELAGKWVNSGHAAPAEPVEVKAAAKRHRAPREQ